MIKKQFFMGFAGFLGFFTLRYFQSGNLTDLFYVGFFAFFANFPIARIRGERADERYLENHRTALAFTGQFAIIALFLVWCAIFLIQRIEASCLLLPLTYAATLNVYGIKLYLLEER